MWQSAMKGSGNEAGATGALERVSGDSTVVQDGVVAGLIGAATIAIWFLVVDTINGRPLYTPTVLGTAILFLFVLFEFGFVAAAMLLAEPVLHALAWPAILVANLLAAAAMAIYFRRRHSGMRIEP